MRVKLTDALSELERRAGASGTDRREREEDRGSSVTPVVRQLQLPKINLPKFSGDQLAWEGFRDLFRSLVHDASDIPGVQKLQYLKSCLLGEAEALVANVPLSDAAYQGAWDDFVARYDHPRVLLFAHMRNLLACPATKKASPSELKRMLGVITTSIRAFAALKRPVSYWDDWFVHLLVCKLDPVTRLNWETLLADSRAIPTFKQLQDYLENGIRALDAAHPEAALSATSVLSKPGKSARVSSNATTMVKSAKNKKCALCDGSHLLPYCGKFKGMNVAQRSDKVKEFGLCLNCMRTGHRANACTTDKRCLVCADRHHTMLHGGGQSAGGSTKAGGTNPPSPKEPQGATALSASSANAESAVLLATARVLLRNAQGHVVKVRALLNSGSEATFVSEWVAQTLRLRRDPVDDDDGPLGNETGAVTSSAGPDPGRSGVLEPVICRGEPGAPVAQLTAFGWALTGTLGGERAGTTSLHVKVFHAQGVDEVAQALQRFWELEEVSTVQPLTPAEKQAKKHFKETHQRDHTGQYIVRLPRTSSAGATLGISRPAALKMLLSSKRRLAKQSELRMKYTAFMDDYLVLGHMEPVPPEGHPPDDSFYMPHYAVFKRGDPNGKIRVVFNAFFRTSTGLSLNDLLLPGPRLQSDLWIIITRPWIIATDEASKYPLGALILVRNRYVDDIPAGVDSAELARETQRQLVEILQAGGFTLAKWAANDPSLCPAGSQDERRLPMGDSVGALGLSWHPKSDTLSLSLSMVPVQAALSKKYNDDDDVPSVSPTERERAVTFLH
ncbi:uncharacterized protein [Temnothorax longispinosus]|uniref:uncharacterized protein n=1 Tax=Temnothorax longispinosus TaxID=300112 RepID=UPI003A9A33E3